MIKTADFDDYAWRRILKLLGLGLAGYGAFQAIKSGRLTPHAVYAVAAFVFAAQDL